jgi:uncharacterized membrane protein YfcA
MTIEWLFIVILLISCCAEYIDATLGMGYGTTFTPILLLLGFSPLQIVPAVLLAQFVAGLFAAFLHHGAGNVSFDFRKDEDHKIAKILGSLGYMPRSTDSKVALVLVTCGVFGVIVAVLVALKLPVLYLKLYIGILVLAMGIVVMMKYKSAINFSWKRIVGIGILASFNKGISGGGYGPLIVSGQILSGVGPKNSIGITALAEGVTCFVGVLVYLIIGTHVDWILAPYLVVGSLISVPLSVYTVKKMSLREFTFVIGLATTVLGILTLVKVII